MKLGGTYPNLVGAHQGGGNSGWILFHWGQTYSGGIHGGGDLHPCEVAGMTGGGCSGSSTNCMSNIYACQSTPSYAAANTPPPAPTLPPPPACTDTPASQAAAASGITLERNDGHQMDIELLDDGVVRFTGATCLEASLCNTCGLASGGTSSSLETRMDELNSTIADIAAWRLQIQSTVDSLQTSIDDLASATAAPTGQPTAAPKTAAELAEDAVQALNPYVWYKPDALSATSWADAGSCNCPLGVPQTARGDTFPAVSSTTLPSRPTQSFP
jgi:hypothetical protein